MRGHGLCVLKRPAVAEIGRDAGRAEGVVADPGGDTDRAVLAIKGAEGKRLTYEGRAAA